MADWWQKQQGDKQLSIKLEEVRQRLSRESGISVSLSLASTTEEIGVYPHTLSAEEALNVDRVASNWGWRRYRIASGYWFYTVPEAFWSRF